jgi:hypothetical protein
MLACGGLTPWAMREALLRRGKPRDTFIRDTKELALDRDRNRSYTARMHRDTKELLIGTAMLFLFGVALVVWPPLGVYIHDAVQAPLDLIASFF